MLRSKLQHRARLLAPLALAAFVALWAWPAIVLTRVETPVARDQALYHEGVINQMAAELPWPRLDKYNSFTAPGYHLAMAVIVRTTGAGPLQLQWVTSLFGLALAALVARIGARYTTPWRAALLAAPLATSTYFISDSAWISTDNMGWLLVAAALSRMMNGPAASGRASRGVVFAAAATATRQMHAWLAAPFVISSLAPSGDRRARAGRIVLGVLVIAAPAAVLVTIWGGLTPPGLENKHIIGMSPSALPFMLACVGTVAAGFLPLANIRINDANARRWLIGAAAAGAALAVALPTAYSQPHGRWGGPLWLLARHTPTIGDHSVVIALLAAIGAATLVLLWRSARDRGHGAAATVLITAIFSLTAVQMLSSRTFERYFEAMVLMSLAWLTAMTAPPAIGRRWILLLGVVVALGAITFASLYLRPELPR